MFETRSGLAILPPSNIEASAKPALDYPDGQ
jgi:hypothetical protein